MRESVLSSEVVVPCARAWAKESTSSACASPRLRWSRPQQGLTFNVYRGSVSRPPQLPNPSQLVCLVPGLPGLQANDTQVPAPGGLFYYLVSARNTCGESAAGQNGAGVFYSAPAPCGVPGGDFDTDGVQDAAFQSRTAVQALLDLRAGKAVPPLLLDPGLVVHRDNLEKEKGRVWGAAVAEKGRATAARQ